MSGPRDLMLRMIRREDRRRQMARCKITRGEWPDHTDVAVDVPCTPIPASQATTEVTVGGEEVGLHLHGVQLAYDQDVRRGDVVTITRSADPLYVGKEITVVEVVNDEELTSRMVVAQESR